MRQCSPKTPVPRPGKGSGRRREITLITGGQSHIDPHLQVHRSLARPILIITNLHTTGDRLNAADINWMGLFDRQSQGIQDGKLPTTPTIG